MGPSVGRALVEAYRGDVATEVGAEPHPQLNRIRVVLRRYGGGRRVTPNATWTRRRVNGDRDTRTRRFDIATIVNRAAFDGHWSECAARRPGVAPGCATCCPLPCRPAIDGNFNGGHDSAARIRRGTRDRDRASHLHGGPGRR